MGQLSLFLACFGMAEIETGHIAVDCKPVVLASPADAVSADIAISMMPEDRKSEALFLKLSGKHNVSIPVIGRFSRFGLIDSRREGDAVRDVLRRIDIDERALWTRVGAFSGGNQQKLIIGREFDLHPKLLLVSQPTRGVDIGAIEFIHRKLVALRDAGCAVLLVSAELEEVTSLSDRLLIIHKGRIVGEVDPKTATNEEIGLMMTGGH